MILSRQCDLLAGSNLTLTCDITVDPNVDTPFDVNVSWNMTDQPVMSSGDTGRGSGGRCGSDRGSNYRVILIAVVIVILMVVILVGVSLEKSMIEGRGIVTMVYMG